jgi:hypothetical protein
MSTTAVIAIAAGAYVLGFLTPIAAFALFSCAAERWLDETSGD